MRTRKHTTPLLSALAASMLCASLTATISAHGVFEKYDTDGWGQPIISVLMQGLAHRDSFWEPGGADAQDNSLLLSSSQSNTGEIPDVLAGQREASISGSVSGRQQDAGAAGSANGSGGSGEQHGTGAFGSANSSGGSGNQQSPEAVGSGGQPGGGAADSANPSGAAVPQQDSAPTGSGNNVASNPGSSQRTDAAMPEDSAQEAGSGVPGTTGSGNGTAAPTAQQNPDSAAQAEPKQHAFTEVPQEYFDDALFIGDSRVTGVELYSGWDNLTYYAEGGMTIYNMFQSKTAQVDGQTLTIEEALQKRSFGKIYLEIGINEMGTGNVDSFMEAYEAAVEHLRELQPDAILYVCGIMYVKQSKSESDPIFNNPAIQERNDRIAALADGESIFYLDINEVVTDDTGNLNPDYTWDEVHLLGKYDVIWLEYFSSHGIVKDS